MMFYFLVDLAFALAVCIYVFNCSPEMDYISMGNIFKGLAASGSWGCFDEFNRLRLEVLSVCTVQYKGMYFWLLFFAPKKRLVLVVFMFAYFLF